MADNRKHHEFGPSSLERRMLCPGSYRQEKDLSETPQSDDANEGSMLHEAIETEIIPANFTAEQSELVTQCLEFVNKIAGNNKIIKEPKLRLFNSAYEIISYGYADILIITANELIIIDWKFGRNPVEYAKDNIQLATLAAMAMQAYNCSKCTVHVVQPRLNRWNDSYTFTDCKAIAKSIESIIKECNSVDAKLIPGVKQCKYCKATYRGTCPAIGNMAVQLADQSTILEDKINELQPAQIEELYHKGKIVESFMKKLKKKIIATCNEHGSCGNLTLKTSSGGRECKDIPAMFEKVKEVIPQSDFLEACTLSIPKLEMQYSATMKDAGVVKSLKDGKAEFNKLIFDLVTEKTPKTTIKE